jgi:pimeloyl-ACP methyl ester carboxylesterase
MPDPPVRRFAGRDGLDLAYRELGDGRPLVLLHGFTGDGRQWIDPGPAALLARNGFRVILPDLRGHGDSARPHDPAAYPPDVLADDGLALIGQLGLENYDLGGYSLGGQIALRILARGARPGRAVIGGAGLDATRQAPGTSRHRPLLTALVNGDTFEPGSPEAEQAHWIAEYGADPRALLHVLDTLVPTPGADLGQITAPVLVLAGDQDSRHASAEALASALPDARFVSVPGNHYTALASPQLASAILAFLR